MYLVFALEVTERLRQRDDAFLILHHGKIVTVDRDFSIHEALAVKGDRLIEVGTNDDVFRMRRTEHKPGRLGRQDGLPGLIEAQAPPTHACMTEFDHPIPARETIAELLDLYIRARADKRWGPSDGVVVRQVFITRLKEQGRSDSQRASTGSHLTTRCCSRPGRMLPSTRSLSRLSGIDKDFRIDGPGKIEKDARRPDRADRNLPQLHPVHQSAPAGAQVK